MKIIKYLFFCLLSLNLLVSCENSNGAVEDNPDTEVVENFKIHGHIENASNAKLYLEALSNEGTISVAECETDENGDFEMSNNVPGLGIYQLRLGESNDKIIPLTLVPKDNLEITSNFENFNFSTKFEGTEWAVPLTKYMELFSLFAKEQQKLAALQGQVSEEELMQKFNDLKKPLDDFCKNTMKKEPGNPANIILSSSLTPSAGFADWDPQNIVILKGVAKAFDQQYKSSPIAATLNNQVFQLEAAYKEFKAFNSGDKMAPEIALKNPQGKEIKLSSLKGKVVLIDFWASWCAPCRKENPNVVRLYNTYKDQGFTVFSVSLDEDAAKWKKAIADDHLEWPNHVSDLTGWNSPLPKLYGFQGIPHTVLVGKDGKIIASGLRGESLEQKLKEIFKK